MIRKISLCKGILVAILGLGSASVSYAAADAPVPEPAATLPGAAESGDLLGQEFTSPSAGISLRPPADCTTIHRAASDEIVVFEQDKLKWTLKVTRITFPRPTPLSVHPDQFGNNVDGLLQTTVKTITHDVPSAEVLRNDVMDFGKMKVGMIGVRYYTLEQQPRLTQRALIEAVDSSARLYFVLEMTTPGKPKNAPADQVDPSEQLAVDAFHQVVGSVKLLDQAQIVEDQKARLFRTRTAFANWTDKRIKAALIPEQWLRLIRDGKDVGYTYTVEEVDPKGKIAGEDVVAIGVRSRTWPEAGMQEDAESWLRTTIDRKHETWSIIARSVDAKGEINEQNELGSFDLIDKAVALAPPPDTVGDAPGDGPLGQRNVDVRGEGTINVTITRKKLTVPPIVRHPAVWYIPLAISHLLPRLLPLNEARTYLFQIWVSDRGELIHRYVDVCPPEEVTLDGKTYTAVPIKDHIGLDGSITIHYMSVTDGSFLGSVSTYRGQDQKLTTITVLPSDAATLQKLWEKPDLRRPAEPPAGTTGTP